MFRCQFQRDGRAHRTAAALVLLATGAASAQTPKAGPEAVPSASGAPSAIRQSRAAQPVNRPFAARRVVFQFDFEPNVDDVFKLPRYWDLAQDGSSATGPRPGFPAWNTAEFDSSAAYSGSRSVQLTTKGGSVSLRLQAGVIPVFPGTEHLVSARVQTRGLTHARAVVTARYLDKSNVPILGSESRSELISTLPGEWRLAIAPLAAGFKGAAYVQIDLEILQPERMGHAELDAHQVWAQDFAGAAWFDQVAVVQLPEVSIKTQSPLNIIQSPEKPRISVAVRDLTGEQITGHFTLQDAAGAVVDSALQPNAGGSSAWDWEPKVARFGWYRATLELRSEQRRVGATYIDLLWLPPPIRPAHSQDSGRFSTILTELPADQRMRLPELIDAAGSGVVTIPIWSAETTSKSLEELTTGLIPVVERLGSADRRITFSLPRIPDALAFQLRLDPMKPLALFAAHEKEWGPFLVPLLDRYGQGVQHWQIGEASAGARPLDPSPSDIAAASSLLSRLVPGPVIELPWSADLGSAKYAKAPVEVLAVLPHEASDVGIPDLSATWASFKVPTVVLDTLPQPAYSRLDTCIDLVKKATQLWASSELPPRLALVQPWDWPTGLHLTPMPRAQFAAWHNLIDRLRDRRYAGRLTPAPGITCIILGPAPGTTRSGALAIWVESPPQPGELGTVDLYLGDNPVDLVDVFGNRRSLGPTAWTQPGNGDKKLSKPPTAHRIPVSDQPIFVENVDVDLAQFAAGFRLDPPFAASSKNEHEIAMVLVNPWKSRIEGTATVLEPGGLSTDPSLRDRSWRITPRSLPFSIGPGEAVRLPMLVAFSGVEEAGPKDFLVEVELSGTKDYAPLRVHTPLEIGIADFQLDLVYQISGPDVKVEAQITNRGKAISTYEVNGFAEGFARVKASVSDLPPGATATRMLAFPGGAQKLKGQKVSVNLQDISTQSRINRSVAIE